VNWLKLNPSDEAVILEEFGFCLLWITSDQIKLLDEWYEIPISSMDTFRAVVKASWEQNGVYPFFKKRDQLNTFLEQLESVNQNTEELLSWFVNTQVTSKNMGAWMSVISDCSIRKQLDILSSTVSSLYASSHSITFGAYNRAADKLGRLWMDSPGYRSDWDEYLYSIFYKELAGPPSDIANDEVNVLLFREFWRQVSLNMSEYSIRKFERDLVKWSIDNSALGLTVDPKLSISSSLEIPGFQIS